MFGYIFLAALVAAVAGAGAGYWWRQRNIDEDLKDLNLTRERLAATAREQESKLEAKANKDLLNRRDELEKEQQQRRKEFQQEEARVDKRRADVEQRAEKLEGREREISKRQSTLDKQANELEKRKLDQIAELERVSGLTREEAVAQLIAAVETSARADMARTIRQIEDEAREEGEARARKLLVVAMQRVAGDQVSTHAVSIVPIPSEEMKGRIIGRAGRNIRAFEQAAGVDVVVDDTPEAITVASFDPMRREVARRSLTKLISDGRIQPAHIEKLVEDARREVDVIVKEEGERAAYEAGVPGLNMEILRLLGRLKFRTSYGQDQHAHAVETALLSGVIAAEIGANVALAKAGGLLHDLGKAVDHEIEGTHAAIGAEIAKRYGVGAKICNAIAAHHHEVDQETIEAVIVEVADAMSGARPGARRENLEQYVKRIRALEEIGNSFPGVEETFALQAGREVRVVVRPDNIDDLAALKLAKDVARKIEETMQYPGQIKVTIIRETRVIEYAK